MNIRDNLLKIIKDDDAKEYASCMLSNYGTGDYITDIHDVIINGSFNIFSYLVKQNEGYSYRLCFLLGKAIQVTFDNKLGLDFLNKAIGLFNSDKVNIWGCIRDNVVILSDEDEEKYIQLCKRALVFIKRKRDFDQIIDQIQRT